MDKSTRTPILKMVWNEPPKVPPGYCQIFWLFTIQIGNQAMVEQHWDHIRDKLSERYDGATTEDEFKAIQMKPGDRLAYYDDGSIKVFKK